jgi:hypothetical protein
MLFAAIMTDSVLRVHADTRFLILLNIIRLTVVAIAIGLFLRWFGLMGAVLVTLLSTLTAKGVGIARVRKLLGCSFRQVLPWKGLASILAITATAMLPAVLLKPVLGLPLLLSFLVSGALFTLSYAALLWYCGPLKDSERHLVARWLQSPISWVSGNRRA